MRRGGWCTCWPVACARQGRNVRCSACPPPPPTSEQHTHPCTLAMQRGCRRAGGRGRAGGAGRSRAAAVVAAAHHVHRLAAAQLHQQAGRVQAGTQVLAHCGQQRRARGHRVGRAGGAQSAGEGRAPEAAASEARDRRCSASAPARGSSALPPDAWRRCPAAGRPRRLRASPLGCLSRLMSDASRYRLRSVAVCCTDDVGLGTLWCVSILTCPGRRGRGGMVGRGWGEKPRALAGWQDLAWRRLGAALPAAGPGPGAAAVLARAAGRGAHRHHRLAVARQEDLAKAALAQRADQLELGRGHCGGKGASSRRQRQGMSKARYATEGSMALGWASSAAGPQAMRSGSRRRRGRRTHRR